MKGETDLTNPQVVKALSHPWRVRILAILEQRTATPREIAEELELPLTHVSYHVRQLARLGLAELVRTRPVRGTIEHQYRAVSRVAISDESWSRIPEIVKHAMIGSTLGQIGEQAARSASAGGFSREEAHLSRTALVLDARGLKEVAAELYKLLERVEGIGKRSAERIAKGEDEVRATLALMLFEAVGPQPASSDGSAPKRRAAASRR